MACGVSRPVSSHAASCSPAAPVPLCDCSRYRNDVVILPAGAAPAGRRARWQAVRRGVRPGLYVAWDGASGAKAMVEGYSGKEHKGFATRAEAEAYLREPCKRCGDGGGAGGSARGSAVTCSSGGAGSANRVRGVVRATAATPACVGGGVRGADDSDHESLGGPRDGEDELLGGGSSTSILDIPAFPSDSRGPAPPLPKVFYTSRTHMQLAQAIGQYREATGLHVVPSGARTGARGSWGCAVEPEGPMRARMTVLGSRAQLCVNPDVRGARDSGDKCRRLRVAGKCAPFRDTQTLVDAAPHVFDIEDMHTLQAAHGGCPYYATRALVERAHVVFAPYAYLINPGIRDAMNLSLRGDVVIIDEGHNIEGASREAAGTAFDEPALRASIASLASLVARDIEQGAHALLLATLNTLQRWLSGAAGEARRLGHVMLDAAQLTALLRDAGLEGESFGVALANARALRGEPGADADDDDAGGAAGDGAPVAAAAAAAGRAPRAMNGVAAELLSGLGCVGTFIFRHAARDAGDFRLILRADGAAAARVGGSSGTLHVQIVCLNPAVAFADVAPAARSVLIASGTLSPLAGMAAELGVAFDHVSARHVIEVETQLFAAAVETDEGGMFDGRLTATRDNPNGYYDRVIDAVTSIARAVPGGMLVFLPSHDALAALATRGKLSALDAVKPVFVSGRGSAAAFRVMLADFVETVRSGVVVRTPPPPPPQSAGARRRAAAAAAAAGPAATAGIEAAGGGEGDRDDVSPQRRLCPRHEFAGRPIVFVREAAACGVGGDTEMTAGGAATTGSSGYPAATGSGGDTAVATGITTPSGITSPTTRGTPVGGAVATAAAADATGVIASRGYASASAAEVSGRGAVMFAVFRGHASEGLDLPDDLVRCVVAVSIPYPACIDPLIVAKRAYQEDRLRTDSGGGGFVLGAAGAGGGSSASQSVVGSPSRAGTAVCGTGGDRGGGAGGGAEGRVGEHRWYELQAMRSVNQSVGRAIRHKHDYGAMIFLDLRYGARGPDMPKWVASQLKVGMSVAATVAALGEFFARNCGSDTAAVV
jgi:Rad3-related DNA helicase